MFHYLFTNDLRISTLEQSLKEAGKCFVTNNVPSAREDKSANNNMMTLGFYFNLTDSSNCAKAAAKGNIRKVVLNFIKKFQFPNMRTNVSYTEAKNDGIKIVPMRLIVKLLYITSMSEGSAGYLKKDEIRDFIFYNNSVAKQSNPDVSAIYQSIKQFRLTGLLPSTIDTDTTHRNWKHEDRQIREMIKILLWSGCVFEDEEERLKIHNNSLSRSDKADIFEIVNNNEFWDGNSIESYRKYMDIEKDDDTSYDIENQNISYGAENEPKYVSDIYKIAAKHISDYVSTTGYIFDVSQDEILKLYQDFYDKFSPEAIKKISNEELLKSVFYSEESTNDSLCYWLEFHLQNKKCFGSVAGGSAYKFGLFQRKEDGIWVTGSPSKPEELSNEAAVKLGREICDYIIKGAKIIEEAGSLNTVEEYEKLDDILNAEIGKYASFAWIHKYYCMIFPNKFATWHSNDWQNHMLYAYNINPNEKYYARSGQLSIIANHAKMSAPLFANASYNRFGGIKQFCRIGTSDGKTKFFPIWRKENLVAVGWNEIDSLENYIIGNDVNKKAISEKLSEVYYPTDSRTASRKAGELVTFYKTTNDTIFVAADGEALLAFGDNVGKYFYDDSKSFAHCKPVNWNCCFTNEEKLPKKTEGLLTSCYQLTDKDNLLYLYHKYYYEMNEAEVDGVEENEEIIRRTPRTLLIHPLNQIIYGAPGTGKTYSSAEYALAIIESRDIDFSQKTSDERAALMQKYVSYVKNGQITFTTFHQSYGYEEFIQGIRPNPKAGTVSFDKADGIFKRISDKALRDNNNNYVIIIDEINRGNISKIFGELITLIEEDKRFGEINQLSVTLPLGDNFTVPNNLYIIGTMNSADKSISLIDTALRRRFAFVEMAPNESIIEDDILKKTLITLNAYLKKELRSTDLMIGHSYFMGKKRDALGDIMNRNIIPLLYEYFYEDEAKVKKALDCLTDTDFTIDTEYRGRIRVKRR